MSARRATSADWKTRVKSAAENQALNVVGILRDAYRDFRNSDRYFKFKALIIGSWVVLTVLTFAVSRPGGTFDANNRLGARLVLAGDRDRPVMKIVNDSDETWEDVIILVNQNFRAAVGKIGPHGDIVLNPHQLIGDGGKPAPADLQARNIELRTREGHTKLLVDGEPR